jgi:pimeloyl-ACP methyl ester carboxylesterase
MRRVAVLFCFSALLSAQLIPMGPNPPVVFLNGYQLNCAGSNFAASFGNADAVLQANQIFTLFFDNCTVPNKPSLETLGSAFGQFLAGIKYADGSSVPQVDVVAHSMGGLVVRSYLAGKQDTNPSTFTPPATPGIRKAIFLATPHFGTALTTYLGVDKQSQELTIGSQFLFDLNTWNNGTDDLRGVDALAVAGNGGTGLESFLPGFDDGLATLTSASLSFARPGRTRVVPACHSNDALLTALFLCAGSAPSIAKIMDANNVVGQIIVSFLTDTNQWQMLGQAIEMNPLASTLGGLYLEAQDLNGAGQPIASASVSTPAGTGSLSLNSGKIAYSERLPPPSVFLYRL